MFRSTATRGLIEQLPAVGSLSPRQLPHLASPYIHMLELCSQLIQYSLYSTAVTATRCNKGQVDLCSHNLLHSLPSLLLKQACSDGIRGLVVCLFRYLAAILPGLMALRFVLAGLGITHEPKLVAGTAVSVAQVSCRAAVCASGALPTAALLWMQPAALACRLSCGVLSWL